MKELYMASAATAASPVSPSFKGVSVRPGSVTANPVSVAVSNSCVSITLPDQSQFDAFVSGLKEQDSRFDIAAPLTVRFFTRANH
jgi:hypothetical protein